jgi:hypothetical protein
VKITGPTTADTYFTGVGTLNLTGTATDNRGVTNLSWTNSAGGGGVLAVGSPWTIPSIVLADGTQTITVTAKDEANNISTDTLVVTYDHTLPTISIEQPVNTDTYVTLQGTIDLAGLASNDTSLLTWINARTGLSASILGSPSWNVNGIALLPGVNPITVIAMDQAGNVQTDTLTVYLDTEPPKLNVTDPAVASVSINSSKVRLAGTASDDVGIKNVAWLNLTNNKFGTAVTADGWATWEETGADLDRETTRSRSP